MIIPMRPSARVIRPVIQNEATIDSAMAAITPRPTGMPHTPSAFASLA